MVEERYPPYESERYPGRENRTSHECVVENSLQAAAQRTPGFFLLALKLKLQGRSRNTSDYQILLPVHSRKSRPFDPAAVPCATRKFQFPFSVCDLQGMNALLSSSREMIQVKYIARYTFLLPRCHDQVVCEVITIPLSFHCHQPLLTKALNDRFDLQERLMSSQ